MAKVVTVHNNLLMPNTIKAYINEWIPHQYFFDTNYLQLQWIPAFHDFTIRDPRYLVILFEWKLTEKVDFRKKI